MPSSSSAGRVKKRWSTAQKDAARRERDDKGPARRPAAGRSDRRTDDRRDDRRGGDARRPESRRPESRRTDSRPTDGRRSDDRRADDRRGSGTRTPRDGDRRDDRRPPREDRGSSWQDRRTDDRRPARDDRGPARDTRGSWSDRRGDDRGPAREDRGSSWQDRRTDDRAPARDDRGPARSDRRSTWQDRRTDDRRKDRGVSWQARDGSAGSWQDRRSARADRRTDDRPTRGDDRRPRRDDRPRTSGEERRPARTSWQDRRPTRDAGPDRRSDDRPTDRPDPVREPLTETRPVAITTVAQHAGTDGFTGLGLSAPVVGALAGLDVHQPFPIQAAAIPAALDGRDVLGRGRTGSGKTVAFAAPMVDRLEADRDRTRRSHGRLPRALVLAPTRELAQQIDRTTRPLAQSLRMFTTQIYGGVRYQKQIESLRRGTDIVEGTPGRIEDLIEQGHLDLSEVEIVVVDEADLMCEFGFLEPVQRILRQCVAAKQRLLFSATLDQQVDALVAEFLPEPVVIEIAGEDQDSGTIDHRVLVVDNKEKLELVTELAAREGRTLIFTKTRAYAERLTEHLGRSGIAAVSLHGDLSQAKRNRNLAEIHRGDKRVLVATDVASRGIHLDSVELVVQADLPHDHKTYLHRSGRTGRAGASGTVVTIVSRNRRRELTRMLGDAGITAEMVTVRPGETAEALDR